MKKAILLYILISLISFHSWSEDEIITESHKINDVIEYRRSEDCNVEVHGIEKGYGDEELKIIATHLKSHRMRSTNKAPVEYILNIQRMIRNVPTLFSGTETQVEVRASIYRLNKDNSLEQLDSQSKKHSGTPTMTRITGMRSLKAAMAMLPTCWNLRYPDYNNLEVTTPFAVQLPKTFCLKTAEGSRCVDQH